MYKFQKTNLDVKEVNHKIIEGCFNIHSQKYMRKNNQINKQLWIKNQYKNQMKNKFKKVVN